MNREGKVKERVITDNSVEKVTIRRDEERFSLTRVDKQTEARNYVATIILNPREAGEIARFILENK